MNERSGEEERKRKEGWKEDRLGGKEGRIEEMGEEEEKSIVYKI
jgi:hypothetical protein